MIYSRSISASSRRVWKSIRTFIRFHVLHRQIFTFTLRKNDEYANILATRLLTPHEFSLR